MSRLSLIFACCLVLVVLTLLIGIRLGRKYAQEDGYKSPRDHPEFG